MNNKKRTTNNKTQDILDISDIRDDMVVLKDGTVRAVLMVSSINFALKNQDEQESIINGYYSFLNSLSYPLQVLIQSRKIDIDAYLEKLDRMSKQQTNELLRMQIIDYIQFIEELLDLQSIMTKQFYVIVPYSVLENFKKSFFSRFSEFFSAGKSVKMKRERLKEYREQLFQRASHVQSGLASLSLQSVILDTQSLIELYYNSYNPEVSKRQKLKNIKDIRVDN